MKNFDQKFTLNSGSVVYVQSNSSKIDGLKINAWIENKSSFPDHFYHFRSGGHVSAAKLHMNSKYIASLDLKKFFNQVSRSMASRSLKRIGFWSSDAFEISRKSTVRKSINESKYFVPFGFVQSMHIASLALNFSKLGKHLNVIKSKGVVVSVYVDDIILSSDDLFLLNESIEELIEYSGISGFEFNDSKTQNSSTFVTNFNIKIGGGGVVLTDNKMSEFIDRLQDCEDSTADAIIAYAGTINSLQASHLRALRP